MTQHIWLRAETKPQEARTALTPTTAKALLDAGYRVTVERSSQSAIAPDAFAAVGCEMAAPGSWKATPADTLILGLKELLPESDEPLPHRHIHFAHVYKEQQGWQRFLRRFQAEGCLYDLEFLVDEQGRRVAAFGFWAGFTGAATAVMSWCGQRLGREPSIEPITPYANQEALLNELREQLAAATANGAQPPSVMVIGAKGRVGSGACALAKALGLPTTEWDMAETATGGPFDAILAHDIFINCVFVSAPLPPFITREMLDKESQLRVICDVSCDPFGDYNPLPIYKQCTSFESPTLRLRGGEQPLDLIAIDHLPSMLPAESSEDFSTQLLPHLLSLNDLDSGVWARAHRVFQQKRQQIEE